MWNDFCTYSIFEGRLDANFDQSSDKRLTDKECLYSLQGGTDKLLTMYLILYGKNTPFKAYHEVCEI